MKYTLNLTIGMMGLQIEDEASDFAEFVRKMDQWSSLPTEGPKGEKDLKFTYRTPKGFKYYSVASPSAGVEMRLHWYKERPGEFYTQGWTPITYGEREETGATPAVDEDPNRDAYEQELRHREADTELKNLFLAAKGQTEAGWQAYYIAEGVADWPLEQKRKKIETGRATLEQRTLTKLRTAITELSKHVVQEAIDSRIAKVCAGEFEIDRLNPAERAKALKSLEAWLEELQSKAERRSA